MAEARREQESPGLQGDATVTLRGDIEGGVSGRSSSMQGRAADKGDRKRGKGVSACTARESHACTDSSSSCTGPRQSQSWEGRGREKQLEGESAGARDSDVPQSGPSSSPSTRPTHPADDSRGVGTTAGPLPPTRDPPSPLPGCSSRARRPPPPLAPRRAHLSLSARVCGPSPRLKGTA